LNARLAESSGSLLSSFKLGLGLRLLVGFRTCGSFCFIYGSLSSSSTFGEISLERLMVVLVLENILAMRSMIAIHVTIAMNSIKAGMYRQSW
jgi:formate hydrogenlyase subunit 4